MAGKGAWQLMTTSFHSVRLCYAAAAVRCLELQGSSYCFSILLQKQGRLEDLSSMIALWDLLWLFCRYLLGLFCRDLCVYSGSNCQGHAVL